MRKLFSQNWLSQENGYIFIHSVCPTVLDFLEFLCVDQVDQYGKNQSTNGPVTLT